MGNAGEVLKVGTLYNPSIKRLRESDAPTETDVLGSNPGPPHQRSEEMKVKCNKCGFVAEESEFPHGRDFFQNQFIRGCPKCDNHQSPGDASMRAFGGERPFVYIRDEQPDDLVSAVLHSGSEAS